MRYPSDVHSIFNIDIIDFLVQQAYELDGEDKLEIVLSKHLDLGSDACRMQQLNYSYFSKDNL